MLPMELLFSQVVSIELAQKSQLEQKKMQIYITYHTNGHS